MSLDDALAKVKAKAAEMGVHRDPSSTGTYSRRFVDRVHSHQRLCVSPGSFCRLTLIQRLDMTIQEPVTVDALVRDLDHRPLDVAPIHIGMRTALSATNAEDAQALSMGATESARSAPNDAAEASTPTPHPRGENALVATERDRRRRTWNRLTLMHLWSD